MASTSSSSSSWKPTAARAVVEAPCGVRASHLLAARPRRASRRCAARCARRASRGPSSSAASSVGWRVCVGPQLRRRRGRRRLVAGVEQLERADHALAVGRRDAGARRAARRAAPVDAAVLEAARQRARIAGSTGGRRSRSASAARRYRPVPPTTIGRRPRASSGVDLRVRAAGVGAGGERLGRSGTKPSSRCSSRCRSAARGRAGEDRQARRRPAARRRRPPPGSSPPSRSRSRQRDRHRGLSDPGRPEYGDD